MRSRLTVWIPRSRAAKAPCRACASLKLRACRGSGRPALIADLEQEAAAAIDHAGAADGRDPLLGVIEAGVHRAVQQVGGGVALDEGPEGLEALVAGGR